MMHRHTCPQCGKVFENGTEAITVCPECHAVRLEHVHRLGVDVPPPASCGRPIYETRTRPNSSGRRVFRSNEKGQG